MKAATGSAVSLPLRAHRRSRIVGIDAARGLALLGMIAIHVMPQATGDLEPTLIWRIAAGTSAALFAFLAGVGLALGSRTARHSTVELAGARAALAARAGLILTLGMVLALIDIPANIILAYYGVMFLLAVPLLGFGARALSFLALGFATVGAVFSWLISDSLPGLGSYDPSLSTLFSDPGATLSALLVTGVYPAIPWMTYLCAGMAVGKLDLRTLDCQLRLGITGAVLWLGSWATSALLLGPLGGKDALVHSTRHWLYPGEVDEILVFGPMEDVPMDSGWWQVTLAPHSTTVFDLIHTLGIALLVLAAMLVLGQRWGWFFRPLCIIGSMTLTLYSAHLLFLATGLGTNHPVASLWFQIGAALLLALLWRNISGFRQGPIELLTSRISSAARIKTLSRRTDSVDG